MLYVLVACPGAEWAEGIAGLVNRVRSAGGLGWLYPPVTGRMVAEVWLADYDGYEAVVVATGAGGVVGAGWAWVPRGDVAGRLWAVVDPLLPGGARFEVLGLVLAWARGVLECASRVDIVRVRLGEWYGFMHRLVAGALGEGLVRETGLLMVYRGGSLELPRPRLPVRVEAVEPHRDRGVLENLVALFNDAFSVYPDHQPWRLESAERYYRVLYTSGDRSPVVLMAFHRETGEPIGFVEAYTHRTLTGGVAGYVALLAVARRHQGRGVGSLLLAQAVNRLLGMGAGVVYLDAKLGPHRLYEKLGFRVETAYIEATWRLSDLPSNTAAAGARCQHR